MANQRFWIISEKPASPKKKPVALPNTLALMRQFIKIAKTKSITSLFWTRQVMPVLLAANIRGLKSESTKSVSGIIIEVNHNAKRGSSATAIIKEGTLKKSDFVVAENAYSPLRMMENFRGESLDEVRPGQPVRIVGWHGEPQIGSELSIVKTKKEAEKRAENFLTKLKTIEPQEKNSEGTN